MVYLTWEECFKKCLDFFELRDDTYYPRIVDEKIFTFRQFNRKSLRFLKDSILFNTKNFPEECTLSERVYHILNGFQNYLDNRCTTCNKPTTFNNVSYGYHLTCGGGCVWKSESVKRKIKETNLKNHGVEYPMQSSVIQEKSKQTVINHYGCDYISQSSIVQNKKKQTCLKRYGVETYMESEDAKNKRKATCLKRYGDENYNNRNKFRETNLEKYEVDNYTKTKEYLVKSKNTCLKKYGVEHPSQTKEIKQKRKNTCLRKYGVSAGWLHNNFRYSKISQELFIGIFNKLPERLQQKCYFGSLNKEFAKYDYARGRGYFYDFIISSIKVCIEFDGDYWHSTNEAYFYDIQKQNYLEDLRYTFIRVREKDFNKNNEFIINYCLFFILYNMKEYLMQQNGCNVINLSER